MADGRGAVVTSLGLHSPSHPSVHPPVQALCTPVLAHMGVPPGQQDLKGFKAGSGHG